MKFKKSSTKAYDSRFEELREQLKSMMLLSDKDREKRIKKALNSFKFFVKTYFPQEKKYSEFHNFLFDYLPKTLNNPNFKRTEIAAPRGNAKTTFISRCFLLWCIVKKAKNFIFLISDTIDQAIDNLEAIKIHLEDNPRLHQDFPEICGIGRKWAAEEIITKNNIKIKVAGTGKRIRGANFLQTRPDLIICDDLENDKNVRTKEQRDKLQNWFERSVLQLGPPDGSATYLYIGTILHYDSLMMRIKQRGDFNYFKFKALIQFPERMDLWDKWERLLKEDKLLAENFYKIHKKEMDAGAKVLWPHMQSLYYLMTQRAASRSAFASEFQNEPLDEELAVFKHFHYYKELPQRLHYYGAIDLALGKTRGDYTAIIIVGKEQKSGKMYVIHSDIGKYPPLKAIHKIIELQKRFHCVKWGIEEVAFQEFFKTVLIKESLEKGIPIPAVGIKQKTAKEIRIESLAPHIENGVILFDRRHSTLLEQLQFYPLAEHDDGPDALEMAFKLAFKQVKYAYTPVKSNKWRY